MIPKVDGNVEQLIKPYLLDTDPKQIVKNDQVFNGIFNWFASVAAINVQTNRNNDKSKDISNCISIAVSTSAQPFRAGYLDIVNDYSTHKRERNILNDQSIGWSVL